MNLFKKIKFNKSQLFNIFVFIVGAIIITWLIYDIGVAKTKEYLDEMGLAFIWLFLIYILTLLCDTFSWKLLIRKPVSIMKIIFIANAGTAINALTPSGDGGEFIKGNLIKNQIGGTESVSSLLLWNYLYAVTKRVLLLSGPVFYLLFGPFTVDPVSIPNRLVWLFLGVGILTSIHLPLFFLIAKYAGMVKTAGFFHKFPLIRRIDKKAMLEFARKIDLAFDSFRKENKTKFFYSALLLLGTHATVCLEIWLVLKVLGTDISLVMSVFLFGGNTILKSLISLSPVEMGVTEAGTMGLFKILGFNPVLGFMQEFIRRLRLLVFNFIGLFYLGYKAFFPDSKLPLVEKPE
ncbi:MAG: lysylphosphatidylglycerol synthase transmembrane domain-containing protein [Deltaproteobacteria bacterium]|jgi:uncharacterized protein (TIRG00374 family)|nr:lysylphosphatidylglycerol synthase transmembrane domain-containing protein [Deltaproteobacteria bacterium]